MRTTLTLEPDVARRLRARVAETQWSMKRVVNHALRLGLGQRVATRGRFVVTPHAFRFRAGVDLDRLGQLADDLEAEAAARGLAK